MDEVTTTWPVAVKVTPVTPLVCSVKVTKQKPLSVFHNFTCARGGFLAGPQHQPGCQDSGSSKNMSPSLLTPVSRFLSSSGESVSGPQGTWSTATPTHGLVIIYVYIHMHALLTSHIYTFTYTYVPTHSCTHMGLHQNYTCTHVPTHAHTCPGHHAVLATTYPCTHLYRSTHMVPGLPPYPSHYLQIHTSI